MKDQRLPLRFPGQRKSRSPRKLKPATKGCPRCENMLNRRIYVDDLGGLGNGCYDSLPPEQCKHRGRTYKLNGLLTMVLCICCLRRLMRRSNIAVRLVRKRN